MNMTIDPDIIEAQWKPVDARLRSGAATTSVPPVAPNSAPGILDDRWPMLAAAMQRYRQNVAEEFTREAYGRVAAGIIRFDDRKRLAALAQQMEIRPFDAQLLIACAVRQWSVDRTGEKAVPSKKISLHPKHRSAWRKLTLMVILAAALDVVLIWRLTL